MIPQTLSFAVLLCYSVVTAGEVTIHRDVWGVPHIYAETAADGAFGLGYAQAEDRLADIYTAVRTGMGTMSEVFGADFVEHDYLMRLCGNSENARQSWDGLPAHLRELLTQFTSGIVKYGEEHPDEIPDYAMNVEPWMMLTISRAMVLRWPMGAVMDDLGNSKGRPRPPMRSNQWAVDPNRSADGIPILLSDPHLTWEGLAVMYEARVHAADLHMNGYFLIGTPVLAIGHNRHVGWALTTGGPDCGDAYEMTMRDGEPPEYLYDDEWRETTIRQVTIKVKDDAPVVRPVVSTHLGPIIKTLPDDKSMAWVAAAPLLTETRIMQQCWKMVRAQNVYEFYDAIGMGQFNEQNIMFADVHGNIAYSRTGLTPIRPHGYDWNAPVPGNTSATAWQGFHPKEDLVHIFNPPQGFMQNCNVSPSNMMPDSPFTESRYLPQIYNVFDWEINNPRGIRTRQLLDNDDSITRDDAIAIALDVHDIHASRWQKELQAMIDEVGGDHLQNPDFAAAVKGILSWDGDFTPEATATNVYKFWRLKCGNDLDLSPLAADQPLPTSVRQSALRLLQDTIDELKRKYGRWDVAWGDIHKVGRGETFFPVGGAEFRSGNKAANFSETLFDVNCKPDPDHPNQHTANNGTMAMILMFFHEDGIESMTCTPWGQSGHADSRHYLDQGEKLYSKRGMKPTWWKQKDLQPNIEATVVLTVP